MRHDMRRRTGNRCETNRIAATGTTGWKASAGLPTDREP